MSASAELPFVAAPPGTLDSVTSSAERAAEHWGFDYPQLLRLGMNAIFTRLYRPVSVLWNGSQLWALLEGHAADVEAQAAACSLAACDGPPPLPSGSRRVVAPSGVGALTGQFIAEVGVGVVHHADPLPASQTHDSSVAKLTQRIKAEFDPDGRLNPGVTIG